MTGYSVYVFILCLIVFAILVGLCSTMLTFIVKAHLRLINIGAEDDKIKEEHLKTQNKKGNCKGIDYILSLLLCLILCVAFAFSLYVNLGKGSFSEKMPTFQVVQSASMSKKHERNNYLVKNNLNDQFQTFDIILTYKVPSQDELELYDIVVYEVVGIMVVHRIVGIEEKNSSHPNERWFLCQGDANSASDRFPVKYSQIKGIYRGERVPFIGSFVLFFQSPAGWLCIMLVVVSIALTPWLEKKFRKAKQVRFAIINASAIAQTETVEDQEEIVQEVIEIVNEQVENDGFFFTKKDNRHFKQKLIDSSDIVQDRYEQVVSLISRIEGIRVIEGKKQESFKKGHNPVARLTFRGKTLCILLALNPQDYANTKYIFTDISEFKTHTHYPMRVKLTSDRQVRWAKELINDVIVKNGYTLKEEIVPIKEVEKPVVEQSVEQVVCHIAEHKFLEYCTGKNYRKSFGQKLRRSTKEIKQRYKSLVEHIKKTDNVREIESDHFRTFRLKNKPIAKITMKGKTLNVYLALQPTDFNNTKYIFQDVSHVKKYAYYPMRIKLTSERQLKWTCELIDKLMQSYLVVEGGAK